MINDRAYTNPYTVSLRLNQFLLNRVLEHQAAYKLSNRQEAIEDMLLRYIANRGETVPRQSPSQNPSPTPAKPAAARPTDPPAKQQQHTAYVQSIILGTLSRIRTRMGRNDAPYPDFYTAMASEWAIIHRPKLTQEHYLDFDHIRERLTRLGLKVGMSREDIDKALRDPSSPQGG